MALTPHTNATLAQIADVIRSHETFAICGHVSPDGDCVGSQLSLAHALRAMGKRATCLLVRDEPLARNVDFMPGAQGLVPACSYEGAPQVFVGVDVPTRERIGDDACRVLDACETSIKIDHHPADVAMCEHVYADPDSASASIIVWQLVKILCEQPPLDSATCAYAGLVSDTGGFRYQNADAAAFAAASDLLAHGVDAAWVATQTFQRRSAASLRLEATAIDHMTLGGQGTYALSWVDASDFQAAGACKADAEPLIEALRQIDGLRVACMLREQGDVVRGSLRAKDGTDVAALARELGGGGHRAAAGFTLEMRIGEAVGLMRAKLSALVEPGAVR